MTSEQTDEQRVSTDREGGNLPSNIWDCLSVWLRVMDIPNEVLHYYYMTKEGKELKECRIHLFTLK